MSGDWAAVICLTLGLLWAIPAWHFGKAAGINHATRWTQQAKESQRPRQESCPQRLMDGRNEIRCWLPTGHEGDHK